MVEMNEMVATLQDVVVRLDELGIAYMVTGSFAMSAYATARTTMDIDMIVEISSKDAERFERKFSPDYYVDATSIRRADTHKGMFNLISNLTGVKVDCIIRKRGRFEADKFARRRRSKIGEVAFWVIDKEDLILSKLAWAKDSHSELQFRDIRNLIESGIDESGFAQHITRLGLSNVWEAFEQWKIQAAK